MQTFEQSYQLALSFLKSHSSDQIPHINGTLLAHLETTCELLRAWGNPAELCLAGLCHTVYGTDGFPFSFLDRSARQELSGLIGPQAESLVYFYASCDREYLYPQIGRVLPLTFRVRFTESVFVPLDSLFKAFLEITFANELGIMRNDPILVEQSRASFVDLFANCRGLVSESAFTYFSETCGVGKQVDRVDS